MSQDEFTKLFRYIQQMKADIDDRFDQMRQNFSDLQSAVDAIAKHQETEEIERLAMSGQLDRQEAWIHKADQRLRSAGL